MEIETPLMKVMRCGICLTCRPAAVAMIESRDRAVAMKALDEAEQAMRAVLARTTEAQDDAWRYGAGIEDSIRALEPIRAKYAGEVGGG